MDDVRQTKEQLEWPTEPAFLVPDPALAHFREAIERGAKSETQWNDRLTVYINTFPKLALELQESLRSELPAGWYTYIPVFPTDATGIATREASGKIMNSLAPKLPALTGGSADLDPSTKTALRDLGDFNPASKAGEDTQGSDRGGWSYAGRNLHFGVREHAMGAIANGLAAHGGTIPYGSTFLIFSGYMRPGGRLSPCSMPDFSGFRIKRRGPSFGTTVRQRNRDRGDGDCCDAQVLCDSDLSCCGY